MRFTKAHGAGNDFVLLPDPQNTLELTPALVRGLCRAHVGLGADGVIRVAPPRAGADADAFMDYRNADGSLAEMCGNGVRCVAKYLVDRRLVPGTGVRVDTRSGVRLVQCDIDEAGRVVQARINMGEPVPLKVDLALEVTGFGTVHVTTLSMGNPHAVVIVEDVARAAVNTLGPLLQRGEEFPEGTNVEFIQVKDRTHLLGRIWERGVGETLASGSGAGAMAAAAHLCGLADRRITVSLAGGVLEADWGDDGIAITGPAVEVASGDLDPAWLETLGAS
ncbi:MAG: diaminopimelate epimerase [Nitriliruptorales bacterium]|nr:diaminopimelate epimerase [Nitriliruptorales bacterium]